MNKYSRILGWQICFWQDYSRTVESKRLKRRDMTLHPPPPLPLCRLRLLNIASSVIPRESISITDYTTAQEFDIVRPGASGKSRTGDCKLLCAVLDTFPVVYNPQRLVHEVNNLYLCMHCHALIFDAIQEDQTNNEFSWCTTGRWLSLQIKFVTFNALIINCMSSANS